MLTPLLLISIIVCMRNGDMYEHDHGNFLYAEDCHLEDKDTTCGGKCPEGRSSPVNVGMML